jgi:hypothetical protein
MAYYGRYYGYPVCCIKEFTVYMSMNRINQQKYKKETELNVKVSRNTGFIPCNYHTNKILIGEMKLEDLIINRICKSKFPYSNKK